MTALFDFVEAVPAVPFYGVLGALLVAFAVTERLATRRRL